MITHIVAFSAKDKKDIPAILNGLNMLGNIPDTKHFSVRENLKLDAHSSEMDVVVSCQFTDAAALERFKNHPIYAECITIVKPLRDRRVVLDF